MHLKFNKTLFNKDLNMTIRRGFYAKKGRAIDILNDSGFKIGTATIEFIIKIRFCDINRNHLGLHHLWETLDSETQWDTKKTRQVLFEITREHYDFFNKKEVVDLVYFNHNFTDKKYLTDV